MSELYSKAGAKSYGYLLASAEGADVFSIPCKPGTAVIPRGTVMYREATGLWSPAAAANVVTTNQLCVVDEDVDVTQSTTVAEDAKAYRAGHFVAGKVTLANNAALTDANKVVLRMQGIVFDQMESTSTFDNTVDNTATE